MQAINSTFRDNSDKCLLRGSCVLIAFDSPLANKSWILRQKLFLSNNISSTTKEVDNCCQRFVLCLTIKGWRTVVTESILCDIYLQKSSYRSPTEGMISFKLYISIVGSLETFKKIHNNIISKSLRCQMFVLLCCNIARGCLVHIK